MAEAIPSNLAGRPGVHFRNLRVLGRGFSVVTSLSSSFSTFAGPGRSICEDEGRTRMLLLHRVWTRVGAADCRSCTVEGLCIPHQPPRLALALAPAASGLAVHEKLPARLRLWS